MKDMKNLNLEILKRGFDVLWNSESNLTFNQTEGFSIERPHHIIFSKDNETYYFRGLGHTISSFDTVEKLDELIDIYVKKKI